jgi:chromosome partitioning protein
LVTQLAVCAEQDGEVCLIADLDPQRSSVSWSKARETDAPNVLPCLPEKLKDLLKQAVKEGITIAILDTAPHSDAATLTAMRHSDLICLPLQPSSFDTLALIDTIKLLDMADKREAAVAIISGVPIRGEARADDAERAIKKLGVKVSPVRIGHRVAFIDATDRGAGVTELASKDKASSEIRALYKWLKGVRP